MNTSYEYLLFRKQSMLEKFKIFFCRLFKISYTNENKLFEYEYKEDLDLYIKMIEDL